MARYIALYRAARHPITFLSDHLGLDDINLAFDRLREDKAVRQVIAFRKAAASRIVRYDATLHSASHCCGLERAVGGWGVGVSGLPYAAAPVTSERVCLSELTFARASERYSRTPVLWHAATA